MSAYEDSRAHLLDELRRVDLLLRRYVEDWRAETAGTDRGVPGLYVADEEVDRILRPDSGRPPASEQFRERLADVAGEIGDRVDETRAEGRELRLETLRERFDLSGRAVDALLVALAPELDRSYEKVFAYLQDDIASKRPTVGLILRVLCEDDRERLAARESFSDSATLVADRLVTVRAPEPGAPLLSRTVSVDPRVVEFLLSPDAASEGPEALTVETDPAVALSELPVDDATRAQVERATPDGSDPPAMRYVYGPAGVGKDEVVAAMCDGLVDAVVRAEADRLLDGGDRTGLATLLREARLQDGAIHLAGLDRLDDREGGEEGSGRPTATLAEVLRTLDRFDGPVFCSGTGEVSGTRDVTDHEFLTVGIPRPGFRRRAAIWERRAGDLPGDVDTEELAAKFRLTSGAIDDAIATASALSNGEGPTRETLHRACRIQSRTTLGSLARKADPTHDWSDIVLPEDTMAQLRTVAAQVKHRDRVYADWGFDEQFGRGNGLNVLFTGPSGTGKTMAAEIIANDADLDMFRIDLASVVSKYIGETEENLQQVFDEAEHSDAILFFDEADALFGERSEVSDSHDRYANVEVSYLLQRMEDHDGAVILASNLKDNIDDAFLRRINNNVAFPRPDRAAREAIWRGIFPDETPVGDIDYDFLAGFEITGGNVKNVALTAAFLAAEDGGPVEMAHVVRALRRELQKTGRLVDPEEFAEYREPSEPP